MGVPWMGPRSVMQGLLYLLTSSPQMIMFLKFWKDFDTSEMEVQWPSASQLWAFFPPSLANGNSDQELRWEQNRKNRCNARRHLLTRLSQVWWICGSCFHTIFHHDGFLQCMFSVWFSTSYNSAMTIGAHGILMALCLILREPGGRCQASNLGICYYGYYHYSTFWLGANISFLAWRDISPSPE